jgi:hypothetical protein
MNSNKRSRLPAYVEPALGGWAHHDEVWQQGRIFLGSHQSARDLEALQEEKHVTAIVNCTLCYPNRFEDSEIDYCRISVIDEASSNILVWLDGAAADYIHHHLQQQEASIP